MEDFLKIPGVLDRLIDAKILPEITGPDVTNIPAQTFIPPPLVNVIQESELIQPATKHTTINGKNLFLYLLIGVAGGLVIYAHRDELASFLFGKSNEKKSRK